jgi:hypothetical protein
VNTEPLPDSLVTVTSPPIMRASLREIARPTIDRDHPFWAIATIGQFRCLLEHGGMKANRTFCVDRHSGQLVRRLVPMRLA